MKYKGLCLVDAATMLPDVRSNNGNDNGRRISCHCGRAVIGTLFLCPQAWCPEHCALIFTISTIPRIFFIPRAWCLERSALIFTILTIRATRLQTNHLVPRTCNLLLLCTSPMSTLADCPPSIPRSSVCHVLYHHPLCRHHLLLKVIHHVIASSFFSSISQSLNT